MTIQLPQPDPRLLEHRGEFPGHIFCDPQVFASCELFLDYTVQSTLAVALDLGILPREGDLQTSKLLNELGFSPNFARNLTWILVTLEEFGYLEKKASTEGVEIYHCPTPPPPPNREAIREKATEIHPLNAASLDLIDAAAQAYLPLSRGETGGEKTLASPQAISLWMKYFSNENPSYALNNSLAAIAAAHRLPKHRPFTILEVGGGYGSASQALIQELDRQHLLSKLERYYFTEPNAFFRRKATRAITQNFEIPLESGPLDINLPWDDQLEGDDQFDLILGINVFHVARDLVRTLKLAKARLKPNGWLIAGECLRLFKVQSIPAEFIFLTLKSFTEVQLHPAYRPNPGFLTSDQWRATASHVGWRSFDIVPDLNTIRSIYPRFFAGTLVAQNT